MSDKKKKPSSKKGYTRSSKGSGAPKAKSTGTSADDIIVTVLPTQKDNLVHPAQHFDYDGDWMSFGFVRTVEIDNPEWDKPKRKRLLCLVTNDGEVIPCTESEIQKRGITLSAPPMWNEKKGNRMSGPVLDAFIKSKGKRPKPWRLDQWLEFTVEQLKGVIDYEDSDIFYEVALWLFGTYCHRAFESFAYKFYHGPTQTGKTRSLETLEQTCFNAILSPNMSPSSLFRSVESMACTLLMDETEKMKDKEGSADIRQLILSGYKRGASVTRSEPVGDGGFKVVEYGTFSPKAFANISGLDDVLGNRTIPILMRRSKIKSVLTAKLLTRKRKRYWQDIRDHAYLLVYHHWRRICELIEKHADTEVVEDIEGRPLELWYSIFVLAELFEENGCTGLSDKMYQLASQYVKDMVAMFEQSSEGSMIHALRFLMWDAEPPFKTQHYRFQDIKKYFAKQIAFADEEIDESGQIHEKAIKAPSWVRPSYLFGLLRKLGFKRFDGKGSRKRVYMDKDMLVDLWERYIGDWEEPKDERGTQMSLSTFDSAHAFSNPNDLGFDPAQAKGTPKIKPKTKDEPNNNKALSSDMVCTAMLDKEQWTRESLKKWLTKVYEYEDVEVDEQLDKQLGKDLRIKEVGGDPMVYKVGDKYREMRERTDRPPSKQKKDSSEEQDK